MNMAGSKLLLIGVSLWLVGIAFMSSGPREWSWLPVAGGSFALGYLLAKAERDPDPTEERAPTRPRSEG
jgi:hypothetical protein